MALASHCLDLIHVSKLDAFRLETISYESHSYKAIIHLFFLFFFSFPSPSSSACFLLSIFFCTFLESLFSVGSKPWPLCRVGTFPPESVAMNLSYKTFHQHRNTCIA